MDFSAITETKWFVLGAIPLLIFLARAISVTVGTIRIILIHRGMKWLASLFGFIEMLIWIFALAQIMQNLDNIINYFAFAFGFAVGNFFGIYIEEKLAIGQFVVRIITQKDATELINALRKKGFGATSVDAEGSSGQVMVIYTVIKRKEYTKVVKLVKKYNPKAFYTVEDVRFVQEGVFPISRPSLRLKKNDGAL